MKVLVDGYFIGKPYGYGRYTTELVRALALFHADEIELTVILRHDAETQLTSTFPQVRWIRARNRNLIWWEQRLIPRMAKKIGANLVHCPANSRGFFFGDIPVVVSVHDILFLEASPCKATTFKAAIEIFYVSTIFKNLTTKAAAIIAVSATTQRELRGLGLESTVAYNTVDGLFEGTVDAAAAHGAHPRYVMHRGGSAPHRNTAMVISAFKASRRSIAPVDLRIVGFPDGAKFFGTAGQSDIVFEDWLTDSGMVDLYRGAALVVATSLREGFGLPIIEGFAAKAPVITSDREPMREVAGSGALLVDPNDAGELERAIVRVLTDDALAADLVERGCARYAAFSSQTMSARVMQVYEGVCGR